MARRLAAGAVVLAGLGVAGRLAYPGVRREIRYRMAEREVDAGRLEQAEARLDLLIAEEPGRTRPRLLWVRVARRQGRITDAEEALQRAVELGLPVEEGRREHALILAGRDFPAAEGSLRRALGEHPDDEEVRRALAEGAGRAGR